MPSLDVEKSLTWRWLGTILLGVFIMGASAWAVNVNSQINVLQDAKEKLGLQHKDLERMMTVRDMEILGRLDLIMHRLNKQTERLEELMAIHRKN